MGLFDFGLHDPGANLSPLFPRPYDELEAVHDVLGGKEPCSHGVWPHQGQCRACPDPDGILRLARAILLPPRQAIMLKGDPYL